MSTRRPKKIKARIDRPSRSSALTASRRYGTPQLRTASLLDRLYLHSAEWWEAQRPIKAFSYHYFVDENRVTGFDFFVFFILQEAELRDVSGSDTFKKNTQ